MFKKLALIALLFSFSAPLWGSGSYTVYLRLQNFVITEDLTETFFDDRSSRELENLDRPTLAVRIGWYNYLQVYHLISNDYNVEIQFGDYSPVVFSYNTTINSITADGDDGLLLIILSP